MLSPELVGVRISSKIPDSVLEAGISHIVILSYFSFLRGLQARFLVRCRILCQGFSLAD